MKNSGRLTTSSLLISFCLLSLMASPLLAESGIRWYGGIAMEETDNPPPDQTRVSTFSLKVSNVNGVCDEEVRISAPPLDFKNDPFSDGLLSKQGSSTFLGFKTLPQGPLLSSLKFVLEDESCTGCARSPKTVYFDVETGEDANGCDFQGFSAKIKVCDTGEHCFTCCDFYDGDIPCETPTAFIKTQELQAQQTAPQPGSGAIFGTVSDSNGKGLHASIRIKKMGSCVPGDVDNNDTYTNNLSTTRIGPDKGTYSEQGLPYGNYEVVAKKDGLKQSSSVPVTNTIPVQVDFTF